MAKTNRTDPKLWDKVKRELEASDKGGDPGQWSARKAQMAVQEYKRRGGGYQGAKPADHDLKDWNENGASPADGPTKADLTDAARAMEIEGRSKMDKDALQDAVVAAVKDNAEVSKQELMHLARAFAIDGRSKMSKSDLRAAIAGAAS